VEEAVSFEDVKRPPEIWAVGFEALRAIAFDERADVAGDVAGLV
jgi:hypothetical protein